MNMNKRRNLGKKIIIGLTAFLLIIIGSFMIYTSNYYHADASVIEASILAGGIDISSKDGAMIFDPGNAEAALIFYPGGKVEYSAYAPLMIKIAHKGILCILPKMPFNLAVFDSNAADTYLVDYSEIQQWYIGGHSLGGSMAASYASKSSDRFKGLVLLASYSTADLTTNGLKVLSLYGSKDGVLNKDSYLKYKSNLPVDYTEKVIEGGNHAGFGCYGPQKGDGEADISSEQQQTDTAQAIADLCLTVEE